MTNPTPTSAAAMTETARALLAAQAPPPTRAARPMQGLAEWLHIEADISGTRWEVQERLHQWASEVEAVQAQPASAPTVQPSEAEQCTACDMTTMDKERCEDCPYRSGRVRQREAAGEQPVAHAEASDVPELTVAFFDAHEFPIGTPLYTQPAAPAWWREATMLAIAYLDAYTRTVGGIGLLDQGAGARHVDFALDNLRAVLVSTPTAQAQARVPLSDARINAIGDCMPTITARPPGWWERQFARAIEAAHGIQGESSGAAPGVNQPDGAKR